MFAPQFIAVGWEEVIPVVIAILVLLASGLSNLLGDKRPPPKRGPMAPPGRPGGRPQVDDEIGEFLRRAAERRGQQRPQAMPAPPMVAAEAVPEKQRSARREPGRRESRPAQRRLGETERRPPLVAAEAVSEEGPRRTLRPSIDHAVGSLTPSVSMPAAPAADVVAAVVPGEELPATAAAGFGALLSDAESVRQAIVINEILRRPEERWA